MDDIKQVISTPNAPDAIGPYSQAIKIDGLMFLSGQIPINPATNTVIEGDITAQTNQVMSNIKSILQSQGSTLQNIVKTTIFLTNLNDFPIVNEVYGSYFPNNPPARSCLQVSALPKNVAIEIEVIAAL
ncbi:MAG: RidA family protein [Clostridiales bacterium]|jgi:2-iminobutanoate/2-iminopropanoate deaminase|nr:RidA family protein [Clostridiales bacterium]